MVGFIIGLLAGSLVGVVIMSLCMVAGDDKSDIDE